MKNRDTNRFCGQRRFCWLQGFQPLKSLICRRNVSRLFRPHLFAAACAAISVVFPGASATAADTGGPVWTLDLASKTMRNPDPVALRENAIFTIKPIGRSAAEDLVVMFTDRKTGEQLAYTEGLTDATNHNNAALGSISLNTEPMRKQFEKLPPYGEISALVTIWNTNASRMVAQDFVRVINNPLVVTWTNYDPESISGDLSAYIARMNQQYDDLSGEVARIEAHTNMFTEASYNPSEGKTTVSGHGTLQFSGINTVSVQNGGLAGNSINAASDITLQGERIETWSDLFATNSAAANGVWQAIHDESNRATEVEAGLATDIATVSNDLSFFATNTFPAATNALHSAITNEEARAMAEEGTISSNLTAVSNAFNTFTGEVARATNAINLRIDGIQGSLTGIVYGIELNGNEYYPTNYEGEYREDGLVPLPDVLMAGQESNFVHGITLNGTNYSPNAGDFFVELPPYPSTNNFATREDLSASTNNVLSSVSNRFTLSSAYADATNRIWGDINTLSRKLWQIAGVITNGTNMNTLSNFFYTLDAVSLRVSNNTAAITGVSNDVVSLQNQILNLDEDEQLVAKLADKMSDDYIPRAEFTNNVFNWDTNGSVWMAGNSAAGADHGFAVGWESLVSGPYGFAAGLGSWSLGLGSVAIGSHAVARDESAVALGLEADAGGYAAVALGHQAAADDDLSLVWNGMRQKYHSHGERTANFNPTNGLGGFFIGETNLATVFSEYAKTGYVYAAVAELGESVTSNAIGIASNSAAIATNTANIATNAAHISEIAEALALLNPVIETPDGKKWTAVGIYADNGIPTHAWVSWSGTYSAPIVIHMADNRHFKMVGTYADGNTNWVTHTWEEIQ